MSALWSTQHNKPYRRSKLKIYGGWGYTIAGAPLKNNVKLWMQN
jgi:hypothetical protein